MAKHMYKRNSKKRNVSKVVTRNVKIAIVWIQRTTWVAVILTLIYTSLMEVGVLDGFEKKQQSLVPKTYEVMSISKGSKDTPQIPASLLNGTIPNFPAPVVGIQEIFETAKDLKTIEISGTEEETDSKKIPEAKKTLVPQDKQTADFQRSENEEVVVGEEVEFQQYIYSENEEDWPDNYRYYKGEILEPKLGMISGPTGTETYYNLPMEGVVNIMRNQGNTDEYWEREDGVKMLGNYVMVSACLDIHPRGSIVKTTLGWGMVCDTGSFAIEDPYRLDIAVNW